VTPEEEYEEHRFKVWEDDGVGMPTWDELDEFDKTEWKKWISGGSVEEDRPYAHG
jgi:hypothetical protein